MKRLNFARAVTKHIDDWVIKNYHLVVVKLSIIFNVVHYCQNVMKIQSILMVGFFSFNVCRCHFTHMEYQQKMSIYHSLCQYLYIFITETT